METEASWNDIHFECAACGQKIVTDIATEGLETACPVCNAKITIPTATESPRRSASSIEPPPILPKTNPPSVAVSSSRPISDPVQKISSRQALNTFGWIQIFGVLCLVVAALFVIGAFLLPSRLLFLLSTGLIIGSIGGGMLSSAKSDMKTLRVAEDLINQGLSPKDALVKLITTNSQVPELWRETALRIVSGEEYSSTVSWLRGEKGLVFPAAVETFRAAFGLTHHYKSQLVSIGTEIDGLAFTFKAVRYTGRSLALSTFSTKWKGLARSYNIGPGLLVIGCNQKLICTIEELSHFATSDDNAAVELIVLSVFPNDLGQHSITVGVAKLNAKGFASVLKRAETCTISDSPRMDFI
jgi:DNA-directed RNA polymerase subunit RPC12/RpoP